MPVYVLNARLKTDLELKPTSNRICNIFFLRDEKSSKRCLASSIRYRLMKWKKLEWNDSLITWERCRDGMHNLSASSLRVRDDSKWGL